MAAIFCARYFRPAYARELDPDYSTLPWPPRPVGREAHEENKEQAKAEASEIQQKSRNNKYSVFISLLGYAIGLTTVWRFCYFTLRNGGGAFVLVHFILSLLVAFPVVYLEMALGQFSSLSQIKVWRLCPIAKGIGYAGTLVRAFRLMYTPVILSWAVFYLFASLGRELPWASCGNFWNTASCFDITAPQTAVVPTTGLSSPVEEFWRYRLHMQSSGMDKIGNIRWELLLISFLMWFITALTLSREIKSLAKVAYFTAIFPFIALIILVVRGVTLPGAADGLKFFFLPNWNALGKINLWTDAILHLIYSYGIGCGPYINLSSYNKFHNNCQRDAIIIIVLHLLTHLLIGVAVFSVLGFLSFQLGVSIQDVVKSGEGIAFISFSAGLTQLPLAPIWAALFFFMLFTLGTDTMFGFVNSIVSAITEDIPRLQTRRWLVVIVFCVVLWAAGIVVTTQSGVYWVNLLEWHVGGYTLLVILLLEIGTVMYTYGYLRFADDIYTMLGHYPNWFFVLSWNIISPIILLSVFIARCFGPQNVTEGYVYPDWAETVGWMIAFSILGTIPTAAIFGTCRNVAGKGWRVVDMFRPDPKWGPALNVHRKERGLPLLGEELEDSPDGNEETIEVRDEDADMSEPDSPINEPHLTDADINYDEQKLITYSTPAAPATITHRHAPNLYPNLEVPTEVLMQQSTQSEFKIVKVSSSEGPIRPEPQSHLHPPPQPEPQRSIFKISSSSFSQPARQQPAVVKSVRFAGQPPRQTPVVVSRPGTVLPTAGGRGGVAISPTRYVVIPQTVTSPPIIAAAPVQTYVPVYTGVNPVMQF